MKKEFEVQSSDGSTTYVVEFLLEPSKLHVYCSCPAGMLGKWCKHKMQLVSGDVSGVLGSSNAADFSEVQSWVKNSEFPRLLVEIKLAEDDIQVAKIKLANIKKVLETAAKKGVTI